LLFRLWSGDQLREQEAVIAPRPTQRVTPVGEACASCDSQPSRIAFENQLDRTPQSEVHDARVSAGQVVGKPAILLRQAKLTSSNHQLAPTARRSRERKVSRL
jgi:hypothetical protein